MTAPLWRDTYATFSEALDLNIRTTKRYVAEGRIRCVRLAPKVVRLEPPAEFVAREGRFSGPEPDINENGEPTATT
jgi:hypothetical protein